MGTYDRQIKTVSRLIKKYGQVVQFKKPVASVPDPNQPWIMIPGTPILTDCNMVFLAPNNTGSSEFGKELMQYLSGTQTVSTVIRGYMDSLTVTPDMTMSVIRNGKELKLKAIDEVAPNEQTLMYVLEFK